VLKLKRDLLTVSTMLADGSCWLLLLLEKARMISGNFCRLEAVVLYFMWLAMGLKFGRCL